MSRDVQSMKVGWQGWQQWCLFLCTNGLSPILLAWTALSIDLSRRAVPTSIHPKYKLDSPGQVHNDAQCLYLPWDSSCGMAEDWTLLCFCGHFGFPTRSIKGIGWKWLKYLSALICFDPNGMEAGAFFGARGLQRHSTQKCKLQPCPDSQVLSSLYWMPHPKIFVSLGNFCSCTPGESPQEVLAFEVWQNGFRTRDMHWKPKTPVCSSHDIDCTCRCGLFLWQTGKTAKIGHGTWQPWHLKSGVSSS